MSRSSLTAIRLRELLHYDEHTGLFTWLVNRGSRAKAGDSAGSPNTRGYIQIMVDKHNYTAHRLAVLYMTGKWPMHQVDHENAIRSDNRWKNLRPATIAQNMQNLRRARTDNKCGLLGVSPNRDGWAASIKLQGSKRHLGTFPTPELAYAAYLEAKAALHPFQTLI